MGEDFKVETDPMTMLLTSLNSLVNGNPNRSTALTDEAGGRKVDTCLCDDTNAWETGIQRQEGGWDIVQQYPDAREAAEGHAKWVKALTDDPQTETPDINLLGHYLFSDDD